MLSLIVFATDLFFCNFHKAKFTKKFLTDWKVFVIKTAEEFQYSVYKKVVRFYTIPPKLIQVSGKSVFTNK